MYSCPHQPLLSPMSHVISPISDVRLRILHVNLDYSSRDSILLGIEGETGFQHGVVLASAGRLVIKAIVAKATVG